PSSCAYHQEIGHLAGPHKRFGNGTNQYLTSDDHRGFKRIGHLRRLVDYRLRVRHRGVLDPIGSDVTTDWGDADRAEYSLTQFCLAYRPFHGILRVLGTVDADHDLSFVAEHFGPSDAFSHRAFFECAQGLPWDASSPVLRLTRPNSSWPRRN